MSKKLFEGDINNNSDNEKYEDIDYMTPLEKLYKLHILDLLRNKYGYNKMADILERFKLLFLDMKDGIAYVKGKYLVIVISQRVDLDQVITYIKHEIMHVYFDHIKKYVEKYPFLFDDNAHPFSLDHLKLDKALKDLLWVSGNLVNDLHLGRHYDDKDKNNALNMRIAKDAILEVANDFFSMTGRGIEDQIEFSHGLVAELDNPGVSTGISYDEYLQEYEKAIKKTSKYLRRIYPQ